MSHRKPVYDAHQGASRTRDATVPRNARLPTARSGTLQLDSTRPDASARPLPRSSPLMSEGSANSAGGSRREQTNILHSSTRIPSQRSTSTSKNASTSAGMNRTGTRPDSQSQEVPLLMESSQDSRRKEPRSGYRNPARYLDFTEETQSSLDIDQDAIFGIVMPRANSTVRKTELPPRLIPELQALAAAPTRLPQTSTRSVSSVSSPSTRFSSSPSPWSVSTTATTPTSWSSASPGIVQQAPMTGSAKRSQTVPLPAGKRERIPRLPVLPEPLPSLPDKEWPFTSSAITKSLTRKRTPLQTPAPTPPPRTSSAKHLLSRSSSKSERQRTTPGREPTPSSLDLDRSPLARRGRLELTTVGESFQYGTLARAHDDLQHSLGNVANRTLTVDADALGRKRSVTAQGISKTYPADRIPRPVENTVQRQERNVVDLIPKTPEIAEDKAQNAPGRTGTFSRLGLFGRRTKSPVSEIEKSPRKLQRKGPAAGTGHEGYGKLGRRGRKSSQESTSAKGSGSESERSVSSTRRIPLFSSKSKDRRSNSRHNRSSQSDLDDFASTRLKPLPIIGGSGTSVKSTSGSHLDIYSSSAPPGSSSPRWEIPSDSQISLGQQSFQDAPLNVGDQASNQSGIPALALRRSQRFGNDAESFNLPTPIRTEGLSATLYIDSQDESRSSAFPASTPSTTTDLNRSDSILHKPKTKKPRKLRWNIFRRRGPDPEPERPSHIPSLSPEEMAVSVSAIPVSRSMPYYAVMDSESEVNPPENVGDYIAQVVESPPISPLTGGYDAEFAVNQPQPQAYEYDSYLPNVPVSPPQSFARSPPPVPLYTAESTTTQEEQPPQRQPRLVRVGRIPPVVPKSERQHTPNRTSFSRPFVRAPALEDHNSTPSIPDEERPMPLQISTDLLPSRPFASPDTYLPASAPGFGDYELMRFPSRQTSEVSTSSSSGDFRSILGPALVPGVRGSGLIRRPGTYLPSSPSIDEVWNEYDDFIDQVMSPSRVRKHDKVSAFADGPETDMSALEAQFMLQDPSFVAPPPDPMLSEFPLPGMRRPVFAGASATSATPPVVFPPPSMPERNVGEDIQLRRSRIVSALQSHSSMDIPSPFSIRDLLAEYESYPRNSIKASERLSTSTTGQSLERLTTTSSAPDVPPEPSHQDNVTKLEVVERSKDPVGQSELHYASLMVAKWLSFGRVLFSPAHDELQTLSERHILVIDGLGNEDWSIYCAVSYEAQRAFVHDLKEKKTTKGMTTSKSSQHAPDNHRRAEVASYHERFPFPPAFFSVVVLRFPPAMSEAKMKNIMSECRRVLMPGGYLELMLLDLDIVNMGVQTRRAVRELKFKMTTADKQISLRPIIDNVQGVLGARGFSNISRCVVGVPVAGRPPGSADSPSSSRSSHGSDGSARRVSGVGDASPRMTFGQGGRGTNLSLNDLLSDRSENADLRIGRIVSRTARTWWQHCFEASVINDGNLARSIFADKSVLGECKARGSSFKMLIAYAQRPVFETRRRTMSEPVVPTLATAGSKRQPPPTAGNPRTA